MRVKIVTLAAMHAACSWSPEAFINNPCGRCNDGEGQHKPTRDSQQRPLNRDEQRRGMTRTGPCTAPGCDCPGYESSQQFYGS